MGGNWDFGKDLPNIFSFLGWIFGKYFHLPRKFRLEFWKYFAEIVFFFSWKFEKYFSDKFLKLELEKAKIKAGFFVHSLHSLKALVF